MSRSVAAGRRLVQRALWWQTGAAVVVGAGFWLVSRDHAIAAALGAGAMALGSLAASMVALGGGVQSSGNSLVRLLAGMGLKWLVVFAVLALGLVAWRLPPVALLVGVVAALLVQMLSLGMAGRH